MSQTNPNQDNTRSREAAMQELVTSAVGTALRPVASRLDGLRQQLDPITAHITNNTVTPAILQSHLNPMNQSLQALQGQVEQIERRFDPLNDRLDTVQNQIIHGMDQRFNVLEQAIQATDGEVHTISNAQVAANELAAETLVSSYQIYNSGCGSGLTRPFRVIPFIRAGGVTELPDALGLPLLRNVPAINSLSDHDLDRYLDEYNIGHVGLSRGAQLRELRVYIGCTPEDHAPRSHMPSFVFMLLLGLSFLYWFPDYS